MNLSFDPEKRLLTLEKRGLDFADAEKILTGDHLTWEDDRFDYVETRYTSFGFLNERAIIVTWTPRGDAVRIISMRKANDREKARFGRKLGGPR